MTSQGRSLATLCQRNILRISAFGGFGNHVDNDSSDPAQFRCLDLERNRRRVMSNESSGQTLSAWQELTTSLAANAADLPHLEGHRVQLAEMLKQAQDLATQQAALAASKQDASKKLLGVLDQGKKIASFLRAGVKQHYGTRAEKLTEFRMRPFRGRTKAAAAKPPAEGPPTGTPDPPTTTPPTGSGH
jgi:hypothetical protein